MPELPQTSNTTLDDSEISNTFKLLKEGEEKIVLSEQHKNIILVIGNTGAGKSTFIQWMAGDNSKLISKEVVIGSGKFIIEDGSRISTSTIKSKTIFPELVVHNKTNSAYYDCPGFSDTRSTSHDIASTYFIKNLTDYVSRIKIVLVVSNHSVEKGVSRNDFTQLLEHVTSFIKNIEKFKNSIAIIVTKVNNVTVKKGRDYILVSDETVVLTIANFLQEVKQDMENELKNVNSPQEKQIFRKKAISLVDTLLKKDNDKYMRIGIFRRPDEPGPLSNIALLLEVKEHVEKIIYEELTYTKKDNNDFGYTISDKSKNHINILVEKINDKVSFDLSEIVLKVQNYYGNFIEKMRGRIDSFVKNTDFVHASETDAEAFLTKLNTGHLIISQLITETKNVTTVEDLANQIRSSIPRCGIDNCNDNIKNIANQGKLLNFLQVVSDRELNGRQWSSFFLKIEIYLSNSTKIIEEEVYQAVEKMNDKVWFDLSDIVLKLENYYEGFIDKMRDRIDSFVNSTKIVHVSETEAQAFLTKLNIATSIISELITETKNVPTVEDLAKKTGSSVTRLGLDTCTDNIKRIGDQGKYLNFLQVLSDRKLNTREWSSLFVKIEIYLSNSTKIIEDDVYQAVEKINDNVWFDLSEIVVKVQNHYGNLIDKMRGRIDFFMNNPAIVDTNETDAQAFLSKLDNGSQIITDLITETKNIPTVDDLAKKIGSSITRLGVDTCSENIKNIGDRGKFLNYLQVLSDRKLNIREWSSLFVKIEIYLSKSTKIIEEDVYQAVEKINDKVWFDLSEIVFKVQNHYGNLIDKMRGRIDSFVNNIEIVHASETEAKVFSTKLNHVSQVISELITETRNISNVEYLAKQTGNSIARLELKSCTENIKIIQNRGKLLNFLQVLSDRKLNTREWYSLFLKVEKYLSNSKEIIAEDVYQAVEKINEKVWSDLSEIVNKLQNYYKNLTGKIRGRINSFVDNTEIVYVSKTEAKILMNRLNTGHYYVSKLLTQSENLTNVEDLANKISDAISHLGVDTCTENVKNISDQGKFLNFLQVLTDRNLKTKPWSSWFQKIETHLFNSKKNLENDVHQRAEKIKNAINRYTENIAKEIKEHYLQRMETLEIENLPTEVNKGFGFISQLIKEIDTLSNADELSKKISDIVVVNSHFSPSSKIKSNMLSLLHLGKYLELLKIFSNERLSTWSAEWIVPFNKISTYLSESERWYTFLNHLYAKFSEHEIQEYKNKYNVANINDWGSENKAQGIQIDKYNFKKFVDQIKKHEVNECDVVKNMEVTELRLNELNRVLSLTLKNGMNQLCEEPGRLVVRGDFIKFSHFINDDGKIASNFCNNSTINSVDIFALNTVVIDRDFNGMGKKLKFSIAAPKWVIEGTRKIVLDGVNGTVHNSFKAKNGYYSGGTGTDGKPGLPGGPAGNFFGIANKFMNGKSLTITANGGQGARGQDGGDGGTGRHGENARVDDKFPRRFLRDDKVTVLLATSIVRKYRYYGTYGNRGGNGGNGGIGGSGGMQGEIKVLKLDETSGPPTTKSSQRSDGIAGKGGRGGNGGMHGSDILAQSCQEWALFIPGSVDWCGDRDKAEGVTQVIYNGSASKGSNGTDGSNVSGKRQTEEKISFQNVADIVNDYKVFLRENLSDRFRKTSLMRFANQLDGNVDIKNSYDTLGLVNELQALEKQVYSLQVLNKKEVIYFYQSILNRASEYARNPQNLENFNQHKKVLGYVYTAALSRINNLRDNSYLNLIINIDQNLDLVKRDLDGLKQLQEKSNKAITINQYKGEYKSAIDSKIREAESFIANQLIPEMNNVNEQISNKVALLINETIMLQEQAGDEKGALIRKKQELEQMLTASWIFSGLKFFGQILNCFGNLGSAAGSVTELASQVGESVALDQDRVTTLKLPDGVFSNIESVKSELKKFKDRKGVFFNTIPTSIEIYMKYKNDQKNIRTIDDAIEEAQNKIEKLEQYESQIYHTITPVLESMVSDLGNTAKDLNSKSQVSLEVTKWQVQRALKDMTIQIRQFTKGFNVQENFPRCIENLEEVMTTLISVYDCIQDYQHQKQLADYLAEIVYPADDKIDIKDPKLKKATSDLEIVTKSNLVLRRYKIAFDALKQQVFPLAHLYLEESMLPSYLELEDNFQNLIDKATKQVETIQSKIKEYKTSITKHDNYISSGWFNSEYESAKPFFVWKNERHKDMISNLLLGKKVVIMPNILNSPFDKDSIKFNMIGINLYSSNSSTSLEIQNKMKRCKVSLTHLGNSYYRFNNYIYVITSGSQNIQYSFEKDSQGDPVQKNNVYDKMKSGDLILSPYAMWEIQIMDLQGKTPVELEMYEDKIDLELIGRGGYLAKGYNISNLEVENNYKENEVLFPLSYIDEVESQMADEILAQKLIQTSKDEQSQKFVRSRKRRSPRLAAEDTSYPSNRLDAVSSGSNTLLFWPIHILKKVVTTISSILSDCTSTETNNKEALSPYAELHIKTNPAEYTGSMALEMGDQLVKSIYINDLLTWGIVLARKWTGYRPAETTLSDDRNEVQLELEMRSAGLVDEFIQTVLEHASACGIRPNASNILQNNKLYSEVKKTVRQKLSAGKLETLPQILYKQLIQRNVDKISLRTTQAQADRFAYSIKGAMPVISQRFLELEQGWFLERQRSETLPIIPNLNGSKKAAANLLCQAISTKPIEELSQHNCPTTFSEIAKI